MLSSNKAGPNHLNSWCWIHVNCHISQRHCGGVPYPLTPQAHRQDVLRSNQRGLPTLDVIRRISWERPWRRPEGLNRAHHSAWSICLRLHHRICQPARPGKKCNRPNMYTARGGEAHPPRTQGTEIDVRRVHNHWHCPEKTARLILRQPLPIHAEKCVHMVRHKDNPWVDQASICQLSLHLHHRHGC